MLEKCERQNQLNASKKKDETKAWMLWSRLSF